MTATLAISPAFAGCSLAETLTIADEARGWGYTSAWVDEVVGHDAFALLGALAVRTDLALGVAVVPVQTRSAFVLGRAALTLAELTDGHFSLGIGASSEVLVTRFAGQPYDRPLTHVREMAAALKPILAGDRSTFEGEKVRISGFKYGLPAPTPVPLLLGSLNPRSLQMAGEIGDGVCFNQMGPGHVPQMLAEVRQGAEAAGRELPADFPVVARLMTVVTDDAPAATTMLKHAFAPYAATTGYNRFFQWLGFTAEAEGIATAAAAGDKAGMVAAYSDAMAGEVLVVGDEDHVAARVREYLDAGVTVAAIEPLAPGPEEVRRTLRAAGRALG
ncbi:MAG TPA: LLM class flavin-dependent oxidoreductase [Euzebya sp.]|nr:LLM class flavin-dependent oxidoreductase [Euzebya sp.]